MIRLWFIALFFLLSTAFSHGQQVYEGRSMMDLINSVNFQQGESRSILGERDIEGSPYLNDEFIEGTLFTTSKTRYEKIPLRYNIYNDQIEIRSDDGEVMGLTVPDVVEKLEFGEYHLEYVPYMSGSNKVKRGFFVVEEKGHAALYSRPQINFEKAKPAGAYQDPQPPKFVRRSDEYYIRVGKEAAKPVFRKRDIEEAFPDHKKEVASFVKKNRVRPNKPEGLKELVKYYNNTLQ